MTTIANFDAMLGQTMTDVIGKNGDGEMLFVSSEGRAWRFWHQQNCCEDVSIEDVVGDIADLIGSPIVLAEEVSEGGGPPVRDVGSESFTWTFYRFGTAKGTVTVRWLGTSNGYYSESVSFAEVEAP